LYADKAYASTEHNQLLARRNIGNGILHKAKRNQPRFMLAAMAYNIKRGVAVQAGMVACTG
jgi:IS5 family transposase